MAKSKKGSKKAMSFKFTLLGLEVISNSSTCESKPNANNKMANKKLTPQQKKFKTAQAKCHSETNSPKTFGKCMSKNLLRKN